MDYSPIFRQILQPFFDVFYGVLFTVLTVLLAFFVYTCVKYKINPFRLRAKTLEFKKIRFKLFDCLRWLYIDICREKESGKTFDQYGFTLYCGRQGGGKTTSMVEYLNRMHVRFPKALIVTNFKYKYATRIMESWRDFFEIRNGEDGVIFALDEIHSEFSTAKSKDFPESLLSEISQQRKQRIKIVATSQVYSRVAKPIREQCFTTIQCETYCNRWTFNREYDAADYELQTNAVQVKKRVHPINRHSFVQSDFLRSCFDTYEKIERLKGEEFMLRMEH
jgi:ATP-dependent Clp protease ATP-binding subunit ClpX